MGPYLLASDSIALWLVCAEHSNLMPFPLSPIRYKEDTKKGFFESFKPKHLSTFLTFNSIAA